jgi:hypothetical protein
MKDLFTWDMLGTITGASTATGLITQFLKPYITIIPTQILAYIVATLILLAFDIYKKNYSNLFLSVFNGFVVASLTSNTVALVNRLSV